MRHADLLMCWLLRKAISGADVNTSTSGAPVNPNPPKVGKPVSVSAEVAAPWHSISRPSGATCAV